MYGIIRNATIEYPHNISKQLTVKDCNDCLCEAFTNFKVHLFTCTRNTPYNFICQFYYFMPTRDHIIYPKNNANIYVMKENATFEDDCCNTTFLINKIREANRIANFTTNKLRSIAFNNDSDTIVAVVSPNNGVLIFDRSTLKVVDDRSNIGNFKTVGYNNGIYYLGVKSVGIEVYDKTLNLKSPIYTIPLDNSSPLTIRFLDENQMLVGTENDGYLCKRNNNTEHFTNCLPINGINAYRPVHAFGVLNESAFYVGGTPGTAMELGLYTKDETNSWKKMANNASIYNGKTSDIVIDNCKRIWIVKETTNTIFIYDKGSIETLQIDSISLFNLMIFENYTLVMSHENSDGLSRIVPSLNCRRPI